MPNDKIQKKQSDEKNFFLTRTFGCIMIYSCESNIEMIWRKRMNFICELCGYVYKPENGDPDNGIEPGTEFDDLDEGWTCPLCGASKEDFEAICQEDEEIKEL